MGSWPWAFVSPTPEQLATRRALLDFYGVCAQVSALLPIAFVALLQLFVNARRQEQYEQLYQDADDSSPARKVRLRSTNTFVTAAKRTLWWLQDSVAEGWGSRLLWLVGAVWTGWLLVLVTRQTGDDCLHLTRRFGHVAVAQLPLHYLLSSKGLTPVQKLMRMSHEQLNAYHRLLGRIIITFAVLHAILYLNFFIRKGILCKRVRELDVFLGLLAITSLLTIGTSSLFFFRARNYRLWYTLHIVLSLLILPTLYFHVSHIRVYILEAFLILLLTAILRRLYTKTHYATVHLIPSTNLLAISVPASLGDGTTIPAQHVYFSLPTTSPTRFLLTHKNPYTIASLPPSSTLLVARHLSGTTTAHLADLADLASSHVTQVKVETEGPYGSSQYYVPLLASGYYGHVLLIAGGIGGTFTVPLARYLLSQREGPTVSHIWSVRSLVETSWAFPTTAESGEMERESEGEDELRSVTEVYITRPALPGDPSAVPLTPLSSRTSGTHAGRPNVQGIIDAVFRETHAERERVAVLVCGPPGMSEEVRRGVGTWVDRGRDCWAWVEEFGY